MVTVVVVGNSTAWCQDIGRNMIRDFDFNLVGVPGPVSGVTAHIRPNSKRIRHSSEVLIISIGVQMGYTVCTV